METTEILKPHLATPFPRVLAMWHDPVTDLDVPKGVINNLEYRARLLSEAEGDTELQASLTALCSQSILFWINSFVYTYHQFDVEVGGTRHMSEEADVPFITWDIQDELLNLLVKHLYDPDMTDRDILINKSRDMGASWICTVFMHWLWLFRPDSQLLELSRTEPYVDQAGNMKALFQKHDYINQWLPDWMMPPDCLPGQKNRTKLHLHNPWNGSNIDGESTTKHAASGDRRLVILLDEFSKVEHGREMRSATRDAGLMRIVNSTVAGPGTEYSKWKNSGQIKVFPLMWWDHPDKGRGRFVEQDTVTGTWKIHSPFYDNEVEIRSPQEIARELDAEDVDAGDLFFKPANVDKHIALFAHDPKSRNEIDFVKGVANDSIKDLIRRRDLKAVCVRQNSSGPLKLWTGMVNGRLDQSRSYIFGIDLGRGQGASNSVISIKCKETKTKIGEWACATVPPYELARVAVALAIWVGGRTTLPFMKWENNGPGWDFGRLMVRKFAYPFYYRAHRVGGVQDKKTRLYGWQSGRREKEELLREYDRVLAHGGYVNPCREALEEARQYIYFPDGGIGPACLVEEDTSARKTHGDRVIADALTIDETDSPSGKRNEINIPKNCVAWRKRELFKRRKRDHRKWMHPFDFRK